MDQCIVTGRRSARGRVISGISARSGVTAENDKGETLSGRLINITPSAYSYPLLVKQLLHSSMLHAADQEIVYRDQKRFTYRTLQERISRLAGGLATLGVRPGDTV